MDFDFTTKPKVTIKYDEKTKIISVPDIYDLSNNKGLGPVFFHHMLKHKNNIAQYISDTDEKDTYAALLQRCVRTAIKLQARNLQKDDIICLCSYNQLNSCVPFIASQFVGQKVASLDPTFNVTDTVHLIKIVKPKIFFVVPEFLDVIEEAIQKANITAELVVFGKTKRQTSFETFLEKCDNEQSFRPVETENPYETAVIHFSSGTTGLPKGICLNHYGMVAGGAITIYPGMMAPIMINYASLYWISAVLNLTGTILAGTARVVCKEFNGAKLWQLIDKYKISMLLLTPTQAGEFLKAGRPKDVDTSSLHTIMSLGARLPEKYFETLRKLCPKASVSQGFGQTEASGFLTCFKLTDEEDQKLILKNPGSCGRPLPGHAYKIVDPESETACGPNVKGELRFKTQNVMNGYYNMESSEGFDSDGWVKTGDIMYFDENFCFFIEGRIKEMLKYKAWHVQPAHLEQILLTHPAVKQALVIGIPHEEDGDHPMGVVQLEKNANISAKEIENFVAVRVDDRKKLRAGVKFVEQFPTTPTGKIKRRDVLEMVLKGVL